MYIPNMASKPVYWRNILRFTITLKSKILWDFPDEHLKVLIYPDLADYSQIWSFEAHTFPSSEPDAIMESLKGDLLTSACS